MKIKNLFALLIGALIVTSCGEDGAGEDPKLTLEAALSAGAVSVYEDAGDQSFTIDFGVELDRFVEVQINFGGTAVYGEDYTTNLGAADSYTLNFQPETESGTFTLSPIDNTDEDGERTIEISVVIDDNRVDVTTGTVTITLRDDESIAKNFLLNSTKVTTADLWLQCADPIEITYEGDMPVSFVTGDSFYPEFTVSYDRDTVLLAYSEPSFRISGTEPPVYFDKYLVDEEKILAYVQENRGRREAGEESSYSLQVYSYNDKGYLIGMSMEIYDESGALVDDFPMFTLEYNSDATEVDFMYTEKGFRMGGDTPPSTTYTLDGMKSPFRGFAGLPLQIISERTWLHSLFPSNLVSGFYEEGGMVEYNYTYNSQGYPTGSTTTVGEEPVRVDAPGFSTWNNTIQYADMEGLDPDGNIDNCSAPD